MNVQLLRKIERNIMNAPERFDMGDWIYPGEDAYQTAELESDCGTSCCIGGWAAVENGWRITKVRDDNGDYVVRFLSPTSEIAPFGEFLAAAKKVLKVTSTEADNLFYEDNWPSEFKSTPNDSPQTRAEKAVRRIESFIENGF